MEHIFESSASFSRTLHTEMEGKPVENSSRFIKVFMKGHTRHITHFKLDILSVVAKRNTYANFNLKNKINIMF
jgi:hypothetical protein